MKRVISSSIGILLAAFCASSVFAESVVVTTTRDFRAVPITVDTTAKTYTVVDSAAVPSSNYYYSYQGHRCFAEKRADFVGIDALIFRAGVSGGTDIYCYPE